MWHTPSGNRVLSPGEWALIRAALSLAWDAVEMAADAGDDEATGVRAFDTLQPGQHVALLALVGKALSDLSVPAPPLTAATEGALAVIFVQVREWLLEIELTDNDPTDCRRLILAAIGDSVGRDYPLPAPTDADPDEWEMLIDEIEARLFWDADWEMGDVFLDRSPDEVRPEMAMHGIDDDYFTAVPDDPDQVGLAAARRTLAELTGRGP
jgi:hypothetical protein